MRKWRSHYNRFSLPPKERQNTFGQQVSRRKVCCSRPTKLFYLIKNTIRGWTLWDILSYTRHQPLKDWEKQRKTDLITKKIKTIVKSLRAVNQGQDIYVMMLSLIIVNQFCIPDSFGSEMKRLSNKFVISTVLIEGDPVRAAQGVGVTSTCIFNGKLTACMEGGFCINT